MILAQANSGLTAVWVIAIYLALLLGVGVLSGRVFRGTATDYFVASRGIGPFVLLMSVFGTTMTSFAIIGSSAEAFTSGIGAYGKMVSWSGIFHSVCFFLIGVRLWSFGKRYGYQTQIQFFRDRFDSDRLGLVLFPALVGLVVPYLLMGVIGAGNAIEAITRGAFPQTFQATAGGVPFWLGGAIVCLVTLIYVFFGGVRGAAWANTLQTLVFIVLGIVTFAVIADRLGGPAAATEQVAQHNPAHLKLGASPADEELYRQRLAEFEAKTSPIKPRLPHEISSLVFFTYIFIPFSVAMFPHLFQHWLTARSAKAFKLVVVAHPLLMMLTWLPCVLVGVWATAAIDPASGKAVIPPAFTEANKVLPIMVNKLAPTVVGGLLVAGVLAAIMSSLDSQFICLGSIFTNDIVNHYVEKDRLSDRATLLLGRAFIVAIVIITYLLSLWARNASVFRLGVWCFTGFAALAPLVFAALYWKRATKAGAYACVITAAVVGLALFVQAWRQTGLSEEHEYLVWGMMPVTVNIAASTLALVVVSLLTRPPSAAAVARFFGPRPGPPASAAPASAASPA
ncbi:MAG TPA: sodium:solute symporter family protein [Phycisphaerae bacterium]|nr:sodium:solute symporter family protein [Phycisphaerae bacterium]